MSTGSVGSEQEDGLVKLYHTQTSVVASFFVGKALMITVFIYHLFSDDVFSNIALYTIHTGMIFLYCVINLAGFFLLSFSSFLLNAEYYLYGYLTILGGFAYWCVATIIGFISSNDVFLYVCIDQRCPETHWMINMRWRNYGIKCPNYPLEKPKEEEKQENGPTLSAFYFNCENSDYFLITISIILAFAYFAFMLFTIAKTHAFYERLKHELHAIKQEIQ